MTAQYSGYLMMKAKGAPIDFVFPPDGVVAAPEPWGIVKEARIRPQRSCSWTGSSAVPARRQWPKRCHCIRPRSDVPPPPGGVSINEFKLLTPTDWHAFEKTHAQFVREWDKITGLR